MAHRGAVYTIDLVSAGAILSAFMGYLPPIAALAAIFWYSVQVYESKTFQRWRRARKIRQIRARRLRMEAARHAPVDLPH